MTLPSTPGLFDQTTTIIADHSAQEISDAMKHVQHISIEALRVVLDSRVLKEAIRMQAIMNLSLNHDLGRLEGLMRLHPVEYENAISSSIDRAQQDNIS